MLSHARIGGNVAKIVDHDGCGGIGSLPVDAAAAIDLADYDYALPEAQIAQTPAARRDHARLLQLDPRRAPGEVSHHVFADLPALLPPRALLVVNDTRVIPARLRGHKSTGGAVELLLIEPVTSHPGRWRALYQASKPLRPGTQLRLGPAAALTATIHARTDAGHVEVDLDVPTDPAALEAALAAAGEIPLPPYIHREHARPDDRADYQTMFAAHAGAVAAPTAGLHFTPAVLAALAAAGHEHTTITLHVGPGTFAPIRDGDVAGHRMHAERYHVPGAAAAAIAAARAAGRPIVAVGTTTVRTLEAAHDPATGAPRPGPGSTAIFIRPGHVFRAFDALITNFHVPRSTLMLLVSAFAGRAHILAAYAGAAAAGYRFLSYGDAMFIPCRAPAASPGP